uniref:Mutator-like transposase domain-containing protein n=1 Tax=Anopheles albimanus TaxID=7167 RepID=A0A182FTA7_ANOAL
MRTRSNLCYGEDPQPLLDDKAPNSSWWQSKNHPPRRQTIAFPSQPAPSSPPPPSKRRPSQSAKKRQPLKRQKVIKPAGTATATKEPGGGTTLKEIMGPPAAPLPRDNRKGPPRRRPSVIAQEPTLQPQPAAVRTTTPTNRMPVRRYSLHPSMLTPDRNRCIAAKMHHQKQLDLVRRLQQTAHRCTTFEGNRIVQIDHFLGWATFQQFLHRKGCPDGLYRPSCEYRSGVHSVFELKCNRCGTTVHCASEEYDHPNPLTIRMMKVMLQCSGLGYSEMRGLMEAMEIPFFTEDQYNQLKSEILSYETLDTSFIKEDVESDSLAAKYSSRENLQNILKEASVAIERSLSAVAASTEFANW